MPNITEILTALLGPRYPTQEEIMTEPVKHKKEVLEAARAWRKNVWKEKKRGTPKERFDALGELVQTLAAIYEKPVTLEFSADTNQGPHYNPANQTIYIDQSLSIISTLHELAHHLFGKSELQACRWSIWLFKKVWPKAFAKLIWRGHMLVRQ